MSEEFAYFKFESLPDDIKKAHGIRSKSRIDCTFYCDKVHCGYSGLEPFKNDKGQLFFFVTPASSYITADSKRIAEWSLTNKGLNFSSIYIEDTDYPEFGFGYPNGKRTLSNGSNNPLFKYRADGYLFVFNKDITLLELIVIPASRNLISSYYQALIDGELDSELKRLRENSQPYFNYQQSSQLSLAIVR